MLQLAQSLIDRQMRSRGMTPIVPTRDREAALREP
jgi:hypothetical protein